MASEIDSRSRWPRILSWAVHLFTASGAVLGVGVLVCVASERFGYAALLMLTTQLIDAVDGSLARAARVADHVPEIDGRRLDDVVDYLNFVIVPVFFLWAAGSVSVPACLAAPVLASAYGFARVDAKTDDDFFLGFPSYWNVLALYLWLLDVDPRAGTAWVVGLSIAVFVPLKYLYPSKVEPRSLRVALGAGGLLWTAALAACVVAPELTQSLALAPASLAYPIWYLWLSGRRGRWLRKGRG